MWNVTCCFPHINAYANDEPSRVLRDICLTMRQKTWILSMEQRPCIFAC